MTDDFLYCTTDTDFREMIVVDLTAGTVVTTITGIGRASSEGTEIGPIAVSPNGAWVAAPDYGGPSNLAVYIISTATNTVIQTVTTVQFPGEAAFSSDSSVLFVCTGAGIPFAIEAYSTSTWDLLWTIDTTLANSGPLVAHPTEALLYQSDGEPSPGNIGVFDTSAQTQTATIVLSDGSAFGNSLAISADGSTLLSVNNDSDGVDVVDTGSLTVLHSISIPAAGIISGPPIFGADITQGFVLNNNSPGDDILTYINPSAGTAGTAHTLTGYIDSNLFPGPGMTLSKDGTALYIPLNRTSDSHGVIAEWEI